MDFAEQEYWEGSGEELDMHEDDEEADMRTQEELMMQHRYMMVRPCQPHCSSFLLAIFHHHLTKASQQAFLQICLACIADS